MEASPDILLSRLKELQDLLQSPGGEQQAQRVDALSMFIARGAPTPSIRELAMKVMTETSKRRRAEHAQYGDLDALLEQLRVAIAGKQAPSVDRR
jgi:hypothetical protein